MTMSRSIAVILTDDHPVVRDGIRSMLSGSKEITIIGEASNGDELITLLKERAVDVVVLDIELPGFSGIELCQQISDAFPQVSVLILSMYIGEEYIFNSIAAGAKGYLPKDTTRDELVKAIRALSEGNEYFSPRVNEIILKSYIRKAKNKDIEDRSLMELTSRETEVLKMLAEGIPNYEIAEKLFISIRTVESHKSHIMQKLEIHTTAELVKFAIKHRLIEI